MDTLKIDDSRRLPSCLPSITKELAFIMQKLILYKNSYHIKKYSVKASINMSIILSENIFAFIINLCSAICLFKRNDPVCVCVWGVRATNDRLLLFILLASFNCIKCSLLWLLWVSKPRGDKFYKKFVRKCF